MSETQQIDGEQLQTVISDTLKSAGLPPEQEALAQQLLDLVSQGGTIGDVYNLTDTDKEVLYAVAHNFYKNSKYDKALPLFQFLALIDHVNKKWWMGYGAAAQMSKDYAKAINAYAMATVLDIEDPRPQLQAAYCLLMEKKHDEARMALEGAILAAGDNPAYKHIKTQAEALLSTLQPAQGGAEHAHRQ